MKYRVKNIIEKAVISERKRLKHAFEKARERHVASKTEASAAVEKVFEKAKFHKCNGISWIETKKYKSKDSLKVVLGCNIVCQSKGKLSQNESRILHRIIQKSCYVIGTKVPETDLGVFNVTTFYSISLFDKTVNIHTAKKYSFFKKSAEYGLLLSLNNFNIYMAKRHM